MVDLQTFVSEALRQIVAGVAAANEEIRQSGALAGGPMAKDVHFDVAVTAVHEAKGKSVIGVVVGGFGVGKGAEDVEQARTVSRIRFAVPVTFPHEPLVPTVG